MVLEPDNEVFNNNNINISPGTVQYIMTLYPNWPNMLRSKSPYLLFRTRNNGGLYNDIVIDLVYEGNYSGLDSVEATGWDGILPISYLQVGCILPVGRIHPTYDLEIRNQRYVRKAEDDPGSLGNLARMKSIEPEITYDNTKALRV